MSKRIRLEIAKHLATVTLDRADKRNAVDMQMFEDLLSAAAAIREDRSVRVVVMHGDGPDFCAGIDIAMFAGQGIDATGPDLMAKRDNTPANLVQQACLVWRELPVPVIAALNGTVFGAGLQIAMGADFRYASPDSRLSIMEVRWGLIPDMALTTTMRHVVATDKLRELAYTGRIVSGAEAVSLGLVTALDDDPVAHAMSVAGDIAGKSPDAIRAIKRLINESWDQDPAQALLLEASLQKKVLTGSNQREAAAANLEKRPPAFRDP